VNAFPAHRDLDHAMQFAERKDAGTSTRRHTIGLIPISRPLI
jgi:hypothetical protein